MNPLKLLDYGVSIFSIGAIIYLVRMFVNFTEKYINNSITTNQKLADAIHQMLTFLERTHAG